MVTLDLSKEEAAVVMRMRQKERAGLAIFKYAMSYSDDTTWDPTLEPWTERRLRTLGD